MSQNVKIEVEIVFPNRKNEILDLRYDTQVCLLELIEEKGVGLPFGCRVGTCGTCVVEILEGKEFLNFHTTNEKNTLSRMEPQNGSTRLICRASLKEGLQKDCKIVLKKIIIE